MEQVEMQVESTEVETVVDIVADEAPAVTEPMIICGMEVTGPFLIETMYLTATENGTVAFVVNPDIAAIDVMSRFTHDALVRMEIASPESGILFGYTDVDANANPITLASVASLNDEDFAVFTSANPWDKNRFYIKSLISLVSYLFSKDIILMVTKFNTFIVNGQVKVIPTGADIIYSPDQTEIEEAVAKLILIILELVNPIKAVNYDPFTEINQNGQIEAIDHGEHMAAVADTLNSFLVELSKCGNMAKLMRHAFFTDIADIPTGIEIDVVHSKTALQPKFKDALTAFLNELYTNYNNLEVYDFFSAIDLFYRSSDYLTSGPVNVKARAILICELVKGIRMAEVINTQTSANRDALNELIVSMRGVLFRNPLFVSARNIRQLITTYNKVVIEPRNYIRLDILGWFKGLSNTSKETKYVSIAAFFAKDNSLSSGESITTATQ